MKIHSSSERETMKQQISVMLGFLTVVCITLELMIILIFKDQPEPVDYEPESEDSETLMSSDEV